MSGLELKEPVKEKRPILGWIVLAVALLIIMGGIYFFFFMEISTGESEAETGESLTCNVGNIITIPTPYGVAGGPVTGIETHSLKNEESKELCCSNVETSGGRKFKVCSRADENNIIQYDVIWELVNGKYSKIREVVPQFGGSCIYTYDSNEQIESRVCN